MYALTNALGVFALWILLRREVPWIRFGVEHARWSAIRRLTSPALSFMSFPVVNALNLQGILVVIGHAMGPIAVVTFNTARTISRSASQGMNLINNSIWPEMSTAFGMGDMDLARKLHRRACQISILLCLSITAAITLFGNWIWKVWTVGKVPTDSVLLYIMLLQTLLSSFWFTSMVVPMAINKHQRMARATLVATSLALLARVGADARAGAGPTRRGDRPHHGRSCHRALCGAGELAAARRHPEWLFGQHARSVAAVAFGKEAGPPRGKRRLEAALNFWGW